MNCSIVMYGWGDTRVTAASWSVNALDSRITVRLDCGHVRTLNGLEFESFMDFPILKCRLCDAVTDHRNRPTSDFERAESGKVAAEGQDG